MHDLVVMPVNRWESKSTGLFILFEAKRVYHVSHCNKHLMGDAVNIMRGKGGGALLTRTLHDTHFRLGLHGREGN